MSLIHAHTDKNGKTITHGHNPDGTRLDGSGIKVPHANLQPEEKQTYLGCENCS
jgi:hypothetical protein